nr:copia-type polyprotein [Tanacetum cinerariifolium]
NDDVTNLWHQRFRHLNNGSLKKLHDKGRVRGLPAIKDASWDWNEETDSGKLIWEDEEEQEDGSSGPKVESDDDVVAMFSAISEHETYDEAAQEKPAKAIGVKWVFKLKSDKDGKLVKHKARLVAPRAWYGRIEHYFLKEGFKKCPYEPTLFVKFDNNSVCLIVSIYVDDLFITGTNVGLIEEFKLSMKAEFEMMDIGEMKFFWESRESRMKMEYI